jgi:hypothetical protein
LQGLGYEITEIGQNNLAVKKWTKKIWEIALLCSH